MICNQFICNRENECLHYPLGGCKNACPLKVCTQCLFKSGCSTNSLKRAFANCSTNNSQEAKL